MSLTHNVEISWEDLLAAFTNDESGRAYFLDRLTGEIFFIPATPEDDGIRLQIEKSHDRFLEIPPFDYRAERRVISEFIASVTDPELKGLLRTSLAGRKPFGRVEDILSFFPQDEERLVLFKDHYLSGRLKNWMEENNLFTANVVSYDLTHP